MKMYQNLDELKKDFPKIADELVEEFDGGEWTGQPICLYDDRSDFARHEIENGAYTGFVLDESLHLDTEDGHVAEITL